MASLSGWIAAVLVVVAALVPLVARSRAGKRAAPQSPPIRLHVLVGLAVSITAFVHTGLVLPELGSPASVGGGSIAFAAGAGAFVVLVGHAGLGLRLRDPKLKDRPTRRTRHATTAVLLALAIGAHAILLLRAGR
jgi:cytochrome b561